MATKTVTLTGAELRVDELGGLNALIVNNTDAPLYASANAGIEPYADGVIEIKAGASRGLPDTNGTVYLLGNGGRAELTGTSVGVNFSVPSSSSEGGGGITRDEVNEIVTDKIAEVVANAPEDFDTLREIADWIDGHEDSAAAMNSEIKANTADISDIQEEQQTQNGSISALQTEIEQKADLSSVSNPNLLDNPDFGINQRGKSEYTNVTNAVDRWFLPTNGIKMSVFGDHVEVGRTDTRNGKIIQQRIPRSELDLSGKTVTFSTMVSGVNSDNNIRIWVEDSTIGSAYTTADGIYHCTAKVPDTYDVLSVGYHTFSTAPNMITPHWAKLEIGDKPTPFVPPHPALELLKCQRYYQRLGGSTNYCIGSGMISNPGGAMVLCPLLTSMRGNEKTIKVNINGTIYIAVKRYVGDSALSHTGMTSGATVSQNNVILPLSIESTDDSLTGCGCIAQCRDNETYVEISADL